jgi:anaerobic ribonucleoside-triphosphate reductase
LSEKGLNKAYEYSKLELLEYTSDSLKKRTKEIFEFINIYNSIPVSLGKLNYQLSKENNVINDVLIKYNGHLIKFNPKENSKAYIIGDFHLNDDKVYNLKF